MRGLIAAGLPCLLLALAVVWFSKREKAAQTAAEARHREFMLQQQAFMEAMNRERSDRLDHMEASHKECEKDRYALREKLIDLLQQNATIIRYIPQDDHTPL